jgi:hypothetical protein
VNARAPARRVEQDRLRALLPRGERALDPSSEWLGARSSDG